MRYRHWFWSFLDSPIETVIAWFNIRKFTESLSKDYNAGLLPMGRNHDVRFGTSIPSSRGFVAVVFEQNPKRLVYSQTFINLYNKYKEDFSDPKVFVNFFAHEDIHAILYDLGEFEASVALDDICHRFDEFLEELK